MKTNSILNKLKKHGIELQYGRNNQYYAENGNTRLLFYDQHGIAICLHYTAIDRCGDKSPWNSDCYSTYPKTLNAAIDALLNDAWGRKNDSPK